MGQSNNSDNSDICRNSRIVLINIANNNKMMVIIVAKYDR